METVVYVQDPLQTRVVGPVQVQVWPPRDHEVADGDVHHPGPHLRVWGDHPDHRQSEEDEGDPEPQQNGIRRRQNQEEGQLYGGWGRTVRRRREEHRSQEEAGIATTSVTI